MQSRWSATEAQEFVTRYVPKGVNEDLAVRTYTTRLLGSDPKLVLHGGGNTSVKTMMKDMLGEDVEVICIKGSAAPPCAAPIAWCAPCASRAITRRRRSRRRGRPAGRRRPAG